MDIFIVVAGATLVVKADFGLHRQNHKQRFQVAGRALNLSMSPLQQEISIPIMVKVNDRPLLGLVAAFTHWAKPLLMNIIIVMTGNAGGWCGTELVVLMAVAAGSSNMFAQQRKVGGLMVKNRIRPGPGVMAGGALLTELALMSAFTIIILVAGDTLLSRGCAIGWVIVTLAALQVAMLPVKSKLAMLIVLKQQFRPAVRTMATVALLPQNLVVGVIVLMAVAALIGGVEFTHWLQMAGVASHGFVQSLK